MSDQLTVRPFREDDAAAAAQLFFESVRAGAGDNYTEEQRRAWAPQVPRGKEWLQKFKGSALALVAEDAKGLAGFMTLHADGYLDLAYVRADAIGTGVAKSLYAEVEKHARHMGLTELTSDASHKARAFFERQGWETVSDQTPVRLGIAMTNYRMRKPLTPIGA